MADFIATISSRFRVRDLKTFLLEPCIVALRKDFEEEERATAGGIVYFTVSAQPDGSGLVEFGGHCGFSTKSDPDGDNWRLAIQRNLVSGQRVRVSMAGFDEALKYTVACGYDITPETIISIDASYGCLLGREWYATLNETAVTPTN